MAKKLRLILMDVEWMQRITAPIYMVAPMDRQSLYRLYRSWKMAETTLCMVKLRMEINHSYEDGNKMDRMDLDCSIKKQKYLDACLRTGMEIAEDEPKNILSQANT
jgi:hypothetical protein